MRKYPGLNRIRAMVLAVMMTVSLIPAGSITTMAAESTQQVSLEIDSDSKAEIALAVGNTKVDYSEFEKELKDALKNNHGISEDRIDFVEVDGTASSSTSNFAWWKYDHVPSSKSSNISDASHIYYEKNAGNSSDEGDLKYTDSSSKYYAAGGNHIYSPSSNSMTFNGYGSYAYKDFYYLPNTQSTKKTIEFTLSEAPYDALDGVGFFVNTSMTGSYSNHTQVINGYLVFFQYSGAVGNTIKIFSLDNVNAYQFHHSVNYTDLSGISASGSSVFGGNIKLIAVSTAYASSQRNMYRKVKIEIMPTYIQLWLASGTTSSVYNATLGSSNMVTWNDSATGTAYKQYPLTAGYDNDITYRGGFGPLISYQSHGCSDITSLTLSNLKMDSEYVRSLTEVIRSTDWSDDKQSFLVNLNEDEISDFSSEYTTGEIINRLNDDDITYIGWCGNRNFDASSVFVDGVGNGSGLVNINSSSMITGGNTYSKQSRALQVEAVATLIANKLATVSQGSEHVFLTTDNFSFKSTGATLYDGNWSVGYSKTSYDDAHGNISTYQDLSTASFAIAGYYEIYYNGMTDTPKARIRIHEAPVAQFVAKTGDDGSITINNKSYDPEFCTDVSNASGSAADGIEQTVIEYRNLSSSNPEWTTTAPSNIGTDTWMIRMTVTDADGAVAVAVQQIKKTGGSSTTVAPYGTFELSSSQYIKGISDNISITDKSYSPDGTTGFTVYYTIKNSSGSTVYTAGKGTNNSFAPASTHTIPLSKFNEGTYTVTMHAISADGTKTSADVSRTFKVVQGYKVTYDANAAGSSVSGMPSEQYKIKGQDLVISKSAPSRSGYTFAGWSTQSTGINVSYEPRAIYTADSNVTLYAVWLKNMTLSVAGYTGIYDGAYHGLSVNVTDPSDEYTIKYGSSEDSLSTTALTYKDAGTYNIYYSVSKAGYQIASGMRTVTIERADADITLSDKSVSYDGNAHEIDAADVKGVNSSDKPSGTVAYKYYVDKNCTELTTNANSGAAYEGAAPVYDGTYYIKAYMEQDTNYNASVSNTAVLSILKYTVGFYNDGIGTETEPYTGIVAGSKISAPKAPVDEIYYFMGWYKEASLTTLWNFDSDVVTDNVTLYAKWQKKSTFETHWTDENGEDRYGSFDEAVNAANDKKNKNPDSRPSFDIQNDVLIDDAVTLPEGTDINIVSPGKLDVSPGGYLTIPENTALDIEEGGKLEVEKDGTVDNNGSIDNSGYFENNGRIDNSGSGTIGGTSPVNNNGEVNNDGVISAPVNNGSDGQLNADAEWSDTNGNKCSGSLDKAIENVPQGGTIIIKNDPEIDSPVRLPDGTGLEVPEGGKLTIKEGGSLDIPENSVFNNDGIIDNNGEFTNEGEFNNNREFENNGSFNNNGNMNNAGDIDNEGGFDNAGTINNENEGRIYGESSVNNSGIIDNDGVVKSEINNIGSGKVEAETEWADKDGNKCSGSFTNAVKNVPPEGTITIKDDPHVNGPVKVPDGVTIEVPEGGHFTIEEGGSLDISEGSEFKNDGTVDNKGIIKNEGIFENAGTVNNNGKVENEGTFDNTGEVKNDGGFDNTGDFNNKSEGKVEGKKPIDNEGTIDNDGSIKTPVENKKGGKLEAEAEWTDKDGNKCTGSLEEALKDVAAGGTITIKDDPHVDGPVKVPDGVTIEVPEGSHFTIEEGGSLDIPEGSEFKNDGTVDNKGAIKNDGTFENAGTVNNNGKVENDGTFDNSGEVKNEGGFNNTGDFNNKSGGKVEGKKPIDNEGTIDNDGIVKSEINNIGSGKVEAEAEWTDKDGNKCTGSLEEALKDVPAGGTITIKDDPHVDKPVKVPDGVTIEVPEGGHFTIEEGGSLDISEGSEFKNEGTVDNKGTIKNEGIFENAGTVNNNGKVENEGTFDNSGAVKNEGGFNNTGDFNNKSEGKVEGKKPIDNEGTVDNDGSIKTPVENKKGGKLEAEAEWTDNAGNKCTGSLEEALKDVAAGGTITIKDDPHVDGPVKVPDGVTIEVPEGSHFTIEEGGSLDIPEGSGFKNDGTVDNKGAIKNDGTFDNSGEVKNEGGFNNTGDFNNKSGGKVEGKKPIDNEGTIDNDGIVKSEINNIGSGKVEAEAEWTDKDGNKCTGSLEEALKDVPAGGTITIKDDPHVDKPVKVPDGVTIEVPEGSRLTIEEGGSLEIPKDSAIKGEGDLVNNGEIKNDGVIAIGGKIDGKDGITGGGTVDEAVIEVPISKDNDRSVDKSFVGKLGDGSVTFIIESLDKNKSTLGDIITGIKLESAYKAIKAVVGEDGIKRIESGMNMFLRLVLVRMADNIENADKAVMEQFVKNFANKNGICKIGEYIDLSLEIKNGNSPWQKIKVLEDELEITIKIPDNLAGKQKYYILRNHDGICEMLEDLDTDSSTITFRTDRFSAYAIVYVDSDVEAGDKEAPFMIYFIAMAFAGLGMTITIASRKKKA